MVVRQCGVVVLKTQKSFANPSLLILPSQMLFGVLLKSRKSIHYQKATMVFSSHDLRV